MVIGSCDEKNTNYSCEAIYDGLLYLDNAYLVDELYNLTADLQPKSVNIDYKGHEFNLNTLAERINNCPRISASVFEYNGNRSGNYDSLINISIDSAGLSANRIMRIETMENETIRFLRIIYKH